MERRYNLNRSEAGLFIEIYLPKKAVYQGTLYETLTLGFDVTHVKRHFSPENKEQHDKIRKLMSFYHHIDVFTDLDFAKMPQLLFGYSLYEVDGVFYSSSKNRIIEERTQVIRFMFRPDYQDLYKEFSISSQEQQREFQNLAKEFFRTPRTEISAFVERLGNRPWSPSIEGAVLAIVRALDRWIDYVALFLFGYIVFEICEKILTLSAGDNSDKAEEEIWVTSFWNLSVNTVVPVHPLADRKE